LEVVKGTVSVEVSVHELVEQLAAMTVQELGTEKEHVLVDL
jgi:hypothetical protein